MASRNIGEIVQIINVHSDLSVSLQKVLIAFQSIFALLPGAVGVQVAKNDYSYLYQLSAQTISNALATSPNIGRYLFPTDTAHSELIQLADLSANFVLIQQQVQSNLNMTLVSVMANSTEFLIFAEVGNFSAEVLKIADVTNYLFYAFNTYIISEALMKNNILAVVGRDTDPVALATNGTELDYDIDCKNGLNEQKICDAWWWSENYKSAYTLDNFDHMERNYGQQLSRLFLNMTTGQLLFENAFGCNSAGDFGGPVNVTVSVKGVSTACISQLEVLTWDMLCHLEDEGENEGPAPDCQFLEKPRQKDFWYNNMHTVSSQPALSVPAGYLGPAIARKNKIPLKRS